MEGSSLIHTLGCGLESITPSDSITVNVKEQITLHFRVLCHVAETEDIFRDTARHLIGLFPSGYATRIILVENLLQALRKNGADNVKVDEAKIIFQAAAAECLVNTIARGFRSLQDIGNFVVRAIDAAAAANGPLLSSEARNKMEALFLMDTTAHIKSRRMNGRDPTLSTSTPVLAGAEVEEIVPVYDEVKLVIDEGITSPKTQSLEEIDTFVGEQDLWREINETVAEVNSLKTLEQPSTNHVTSMTALDQQQGPDCLIRPLEPRVAQVPVTDRSVTEWPLSVSEDARRNKSSRRMPYDDIRPLSNEASTSTITNASHHIYENGVSPRMDRDRQNDARSSTRDWNGPRRYAARQPNRPESESAHLPSTSDTPIVDALWGRLPTINEDRNRISRTIIENIRRRGRDADFITLVRDYKGRDANFSLAHGGGINGKITGMFGTTSSGNRLRFKLEEVLRPFVLANRNKFLDIPSHDPQDLRSPVWQERPTSTDQVQYHRPGRTSRDRRRSASIPHLPENAGRREGHRYRGPPNMRGPRVQQEPAW